MKKSLMLVALAVVVIAGLTFALGASSTSGSAKQYAIVYGDINASLPKFVQAVNDSLAKGWQVQGGVCMAQTPATPEVPAKLAKNGQAAEDAVAGIPGNTYYVQALIK